jgi:hypothetical protein
VPVEEPAVAPAPEPELSIPEEPEPEPDELLPAAEAEEPQAEEAGEPESNGWNVIAEAREQSKARVESGRPFVLVQSDDDEPSAEAAEHDEVVQAEAEPSEVERREPVEGVVNRVELYSRRPDPDTAQLLEPLEADGS